MRLKWMVGVAILFSISYLFSQTVVGRIGGVITDPSGSVVAGCDIVLTNVGTNTSVSTKAGDSGLYTIESIQPGNYTLKVQKTGFEAQLVRDIQLHVNESRTVNVQLQVGQVTQQVEVTATDVAVDTTTATLSTVVEHEYAVGLPLNGRNFTQLTLLSPGVSPVQVGQQSSFTITGGVSPAVNGLRSYMNNFTLDGIDNNMRFDNTYSVAPPPDAIEEFSVESHQTGAESSYAAGANVNLVTRSGTNRFHGSAWEFLRNDILDANGYFNNFFGRQKLPNKRNQYGFFVGGPVLIPGITDGRKNHTYFSTYFEGLKLRVSNQTAATVPDAAERGGDFSELLGATIGTDCLGRPVQQGQIYDPQTTTANASCPQGFIRDPFPGNVVPADRINSIATAYFNALYPMPNHAGTQNFVLPQTTTQDNWQWGVRLDHSFSEKDNLFGRFSQYHASQFSPGSLPLNPLVRLNTGRNIAIGETHVFSPSFLVNFSGGYNRATIPFMNPGPPDPSFASAIGPNMGLDTTPFTPSGQSFTGSTFTGVSYVDYELANPDSSYQANADFKKTTNRHTFSFGFRTMYFQHTTGNQGTKSLAYSPLSTSLPGDTSTGQSLASFMLGVPNQSVANIFPALTLHTNIYIGYAGDTWKVTPKLTVNTGIQYVFANPPSADGNKIGSFDYNLALTQPTATDYSFAYLWAATNPITGAAPNAPRPNFVKPDHNNFAPRVGIAYNPWEKTVFRAGFGVFYDYNQNINQNTIRSLEPNYPFSEGGVISGQNILTLGPSNPAITLDNPFPVVAGAAVPPPNTYIDENIRDPYALEWNAGIQQALRSDMKLSVSYVGSGGRKMVLHSWMNQAVPGNGPITARRPLQNVGAFNLISNEASSNYNSLQAKLEKAFSHGFTFIESYTWSKAMDISSDISNPEYTDDVRLSYGPANFDITHISTTSMIYDLPFGRGRTMASHVSKPIDQIIGGWRLSGFLNLRSGLPYTVLSGTDNANIGTAGQYAQQIGPYLTSGFDQTRAKWFDTTSFVIPTFGTLGNMRRNSFRGPSYSDLDLAIMKVFTLHEDLKLEFRSEFFNALNHTNFANPNSTVSSALFGQITTAASDPREIQFALKLLW